jgi:hypothetical protein
VQVLTLSPLAPSLANIDVQCPNSIRGARCVSVLSLPIILLNFSQRNPFIDDMAGVDDEYGSSDAGEEAEDEDGADEYEDLDELSK